MNEESQKELIRYILRQMLDEHFKTKTRMAKALNVELRTIQKTFSQLEKNASKGGSIVLEKNLVYCARNGVSVDELIAAYKMKQQSIKAEEWRVDFPVPEGIDEQMMDLYRHADAYVQCVAKHMCPHCLWECHSNEGDNWLWSDCIVSRISMLMR